MTAVNLKTGITASIGILFNAFSTDNHQSALHYAMARITQAGMGCTIQHYDQGAGIMDAILALKGHGIGEVLVIGLGGDRFTLKAIDEKSQYLKGIRVFFLDYNFSGTIKSPASLYRIGINREAAYRDAFEYLYGLGHRRIALDGVPGGIKDRMYRQFIKKHALTALPEYHLALNAAEDKFSAGEKLGPAVKRLRERWGVTAVSLHDDQAAAGLISALLDGGVRVPENLSVMGFDNIAAAAYFRVPLTTIDVPLSDMVDIALGDILEHKKVRTTTVLQGKLMVRASVGKAPTA
jgi:DNA-binding LacI/PurR family transcriptional regulator